MPSINSLKTSVAALAVASLLGVVPGYAEECPTAKSAADGFVAERHGSKTEVIHAGPTEVHTVLRSGGKALVELTLFQGLFELERLDQGKRVIFRPISDLGKAYPPVPGKKATAVLEETRGGQKLVRSFVLETRKKPDDLTFGPCKYKVLLVDRSVLDDRSRSIFMYTDYYAPDLKFIVAKEYRESDGSTTLVKFDKIYLTPR